MTDEVDIVVKTVDESTAEIQNIAGGFSALQSQLKELNQSMDVLNRGSGSEGFSGKTRESVGQATDTYSQFMAVQQVGNTIMERAKQAYDSTIGSTIEYANTIRSTAAELGLTTEETSKLVDLTDNYGISTGALTQAQKQLSQDGLSLNIDTLKKLSDQYNNLNTQSEKTVFLTSSLGGRAGLQFAQMFDMGTASMAANYEQTNKSNILTKQYSDQLLMLEIAQNNVGDATQGLANSITAQVLPAFSYAVPVVEQFFTSLDNQVQKDGIGAIVSGLTTGAPMVRSAVEIIKNEINGGLAGAFGEGYNVQGGGLITAFQSAGEYLKNNMPGSTGGAGGGGDVIQGPQVPKDYQESLQALSNQYSDITVLTQQVGAASSSLASTQETLAGKIADVRAELEHATRMGYSPAGQHIQELKQNLEGLTEQFQTNEEAAQSNTNKQVYADYLKMNSSKQMTYAMFQQQQDLGVALGVFSEADAKTAKNIYELEQRLQSGKISAQQFAEQLKHVADVAPSQSGQAAAQQWQQDHPESATPTASTTATPKPSLTGQDAAKAWQDAQTQAKKTQDAAKAATTSMSSAFTTYSTTVQKQADAATEKVDALISTLSGLSQFGTITISVTGSSSNGLPPVEFP
jgi:Uncharacterized protein conserved in bacteria